MCHLARDIRYARPFVIQIEQRSPAIIVEFFQRRHTRERVQTHTNQKQKPLALRLISLSHLTCLPHVRRCPQKRELGWQGLLPSGQEPNLSIHLRSCWLQRGPRGRLSTERRDGLFLVPGEPRGGREVLQQRIQRDVQIGMQRSIRQHEETIEPKVVQQQGLLSSSAKVPEGHS